MEERIEAVVVGVDSGSARDLVGMVAADPAVHVAACVNEPGQALAALEGCEPDLMLIDLGVDDGDEALEIVSRAKERLPELVVIVASSVLETKLTMRALAAGALEYVAKDGDRLKGSSPEDQIECALRSARAVLARKRMPARSGQDEAARSARRGGDLAASTVPARLMADFDLVLIGISTGGPIALEKVLSGLADRDLPPILIVQHMGRLFTAQLAASLSKVSGREVREAWRGCTLERNAILVSPGGFQTELQSIAPHEQVHRLRIVEAPPVNGFCPSVDVTWKSVARHFRGRIAAFLMTGMGEDGADGLGLLNEKGAVCIAQDETSSVVWGMPGAAVRQGICHEVMSLDEIARVFREGFTEADRR